MRESIIHDSYGEVTIKGYKWTNDTTPACIVVLSHGMAETIDRYDDFANYLVEKSVFVFGHDHRGHGKTAGTVGQLGILGDNGWMKMKEDLRRLVSIAKSEYPHIPIVIFGHSMGSFLLRDFILDYSMLVDGLIVSGTGFMPKSLLAVAGTIAAVESKLKGTKHPSKLMDKMSFGNYNKQIPNAKTPSDWLSRDEAMVKKYRDDPYCGQIHSSGFYTDFLQNLKRIMYAPEFVNFKTNLPMLILSGEADPVGDYGKGPQKAFQYYTNEGFKTELKLYPGGRHEMLNETNRDEVYTDIYRWIEKMIFAT